MPLLCPRCKRAIPLNGQPPREVICPFCGSTLQPNSHTTGGWLPEETPRRLGKFEILERLGVGSFGVVYKARDTELDRLVALKVPRAGSLPDPDDLERFLREARSAAQLRHPGIVALHDASPIEGTFCLVNEFIPGVTLAEHLSAKRLGFPQAAELIAAVAEALHYAHQHGVIHRDIKPSNIMLDLEGQPHLMDFGLAKRAAEEIALTLEGQVLGTPAYMSPEQARGEVRKVDGRSDVYGLGVILYELLTGELPFRGQTRMLLVQVIQDEPKPPRRLNDKVPRDLETICLRAMAKEPGRRYQAAGGLAEDLRRFLKGEPIEARPVGQGERAWRWCRRNPAGVAFLAMSLTAVVLLAGFVLRSFYSARLEDSLKETEATRAAEASARQDEARQKKEAQAANARGEQLLYIHRIHLAHTAWQEADIGRMEQLLDACREEHRHWEWHYLKRLCHTELLELKDPGGIMGLTFSPDGTRLASVSGRHVTLWDSWNGQRLLFLPRLHSRSYSPLSYATFSPDGQHLLAPYDYEVPRLWDLRTGKGVLTLGHVPDRSHAAQSRDGKRIVTVSPTLSGGKGMTVRTWDTSGRLLKHVSIPSSMGRSRQLGPDDRHMAVGNEDGIVRLIDLEAGKVVRELRGHTEVVWAVAFIPDGKRLASAGKDQTVRLWDTATGNLLATLTGHSADVSSLAFHPDGSKLASGSSDRTVRLWDVASGRELRRYRGHTGGVHRVAFSPDGRRLASADGETIKVWDLAEEQEIYRSLEDRSGATAVAFTPESRRVVTNFSTNISSTNAAIWDLASWQRRPLPDPDVGLTRSLTIGPDGRLFTFGARANVVKAWNTSTGEFLTSWVGPAGNMTPLVCSPDGERVISVEPNESLCVWETRTGGELFRTRLPRTEREPVVFRPDGRHLALAGSDKVVRVLDASDGRLLKSWTTAGTVLALTYSADGTRLAASDLEKTIHVWNAEGGTVTSLMSNQGHHAAFLAFSPDGKRLVSVGGRKLKVWSVEDGLEVLSITTKDQVIGGGIPLAFSPDGNHIAWAKHRATLLWSTRPAPTELRRRPLPPRAAVDDEYQAALQKVEELFGKPLRRGEVLATLHADADLGAAVRARALALAADYPENAYRYFRVGSAVGYLPNPTIEQYRHAVQQLEVANELDPNNPIILQYLGYNRYSAQQYPAAAQSLRHADQLATQQGDENSLPNLGLLALVCSRVGQEEEARTFLDRLAKGVSQVKAEDAEAYSGAARVLNSRSWDVVKDVRSPAALTRVALACVEAATRLAPTDANSQNTLGVAQFRVGEYRMALESLARSEQLRAKVDRAMSLIDLACLAMSHHHLGEYAKAREVYQRLREAVKKHPPTPGSENEQFLHEAEAVFESKARP